MLTWMFLHLCGAECARKENPMPKPWLSQVCPQVYSTFPEVAGVHPTQQEQPSGQTLLIFKASITAAGGKRMQRTVRAVVSEDGKILKLTTSR